MSFSTEQELEDFLGGLDFRYRNYAAPLWDSGVATADELANGSADSLVAAGISNRIHAENIKAKAGGAAALLAGAAGAGEQARAVGIVYLHVQQGNKHFPVLEQPMSNSGRIELFPVQQQLGVHLESVAVEDLELAKPTYRPLRAFNLEVAPNQHVYPKARPTGPHWLVEALLS